MRQTVGRAYGSGMDDATRRAIEAAGGAYALAKELGIRGPSIYGWTRVPANRVQAVSRITGIPRHELRRDLYDQEGESP